LSNEVAIIELRFRATLFQSIIFDVHTLAQHCTYGLLQEEIICDRIVTGIHNSSLSEKLQMDGQLTLETAVKKVQESETVKQQQKLIHQDKAIEVDAVRNVPVNNPVIPKTQLGNTKTFAQSQKCTRCGQPVYAVHSSTVNTNNFVPSIQETVANDKNGRQ